MIIVAPFLLANGFNAVALFPFIVVRNKALKNNLKLIQHEKIHFRQQLEMLLILFYLWYAIEFLWNWIRYGNATIAYYKIKFEREAYTEEANFNYLKHRKFWAFLNY